MRFLSSVACLAVTVIVCSSCATATAPKSRPDRYITGVTGTKDSASVSAKATPGKTYQLQKANSLVNPQWKNVGDPITATAEGIVITDTNAVSPSAFYRIIPLE